MDEKERLYYLEQAEGEKNIVRIVRKVILGCLNLEQERWREMTEENKDGEDDGKEGGKFLKTFENKKFLILGVWYLPKSESGDALEDDWKNYVRRG